MKISPVPRLTRALARASACVLLGALASLAVGCGGPSARPASSLSAEDRAVLDAYEHIRAALAADDYGGAKRAAVGLAADTKPADPNKAPSVIHNEAQSLSEANAMDRQRDVFKRLSGTVIPLGEGVEGYYVMTSPVDPSLIWLQRSKDVDNPYMGKVMHESGSIRK